MKFKRKLITVATAFMLTVGVTGCSSSQGNAANSDGKVQIRMSWWGGDSRHTATLAAIKKFEEKYPNITVKSEYSGFSGYQEKLTTQISGGTEADLMQVNQSWLPRFSPNGDGFYDLSTLSENLNLKDNFDSEVLDYGKVKGKLNAVPLSITGRSLFVNKTTYDKFGVEMPKTWNDLFEAAKKFDKGYYPMDIDPKTAQIAIVSYLQQKTGKSFITDDNKVGFTEAELQDGYEFYLKMIKEGVIPSVEERSGAGGNALLYEMTQWLDGQYAGVYEWSSSVAKYSTPLDEKDQELQLVGVPSQDGQKTSGVIAKPSMLYAISKNTKHPKETAQLLDFLLNDTEAAKELGLERGVPLSKSALKALEDAKMLSESSLEYQATEYTLKNMDLPMNALFDDSELQALYETIMSELSYGKMTTKQAASKLISETNSKLAAMTK